MIPSPWDTLARGGIFSLLACRIDVVSGSHDQRRLLVSVATAVLVGVLDEWHEVYLPAQQASWADLAADVVGTTVDAVLPAMSRKRALSKVS